MNAPSIGLFGRGRLAKAIRAASAGRVLWAVGRNHVQSGQRSGAQSGAGATGLDPVDVAIDASVGSAVPEHLRWAVHQRVPLVIGATGWQFEQLERFVGNRVGVVIAPNGSPAVALFEQLAESLGRFVGAQEAGTALLEEIHHAKKRDAPSGTALALAAAFERGQLAAGGVSIEPQLRSVREGRELGTHRLRLQLPFETLEIEHRVQDRATFAHGLLRSAQWLHRTKATGVFYLRDVLARTESSNLTQPQQSTGGLAGLYQELNHAD